MTQIATNKKGIKKQLQKVKRQQDLKAQQKKKIKAAGTCINAFFLTGLL